MTKKFSSKYRHFLNDRKPAALIVKKDDVSPEWDFDMLIVGDPEEAFRNVLMLFYPAPVLEKRISKSASIADDIELPCNIRIEEFVVIRPGTAIGEGTSIGANSFIGSGVKIGERCAIHPSVTIYDNVRIGDDVIVHSGAVIGSDGFGYNLRDGEQRKVPQVGGVVIEDDVEIGANTTIDCGTLYDTVIMKGAKLDNLIQIGHNCIVGPHCALSAQTGLAGHTVLGEGVLTGGQVGFAGHITIGANSIILAQSGVPSDVPANSKIFGYPAKEATEAMREITALSRLPKLIRRVRAIEKRLEDIEGEK